MSVMCVTCRGGGGGVHGTGVVCVSQLCVYVGVCECKFMIQVLCVSRLCVWC